MKQYRNSLRYRISGKLYQGFPFKQDKVPELDEFVYHPRKGAIGRVIGFGGDTVTVQTMFGSKVKCKIKELTYLKEVK